MTTPATATPGTPATSATTPETRAAGGAGACALTLAPLSLDRFLASHWDREPLLVQRGEPDRFVSLLSTSHVERMVCGSRMRAPGFRLVRDGAQVPPGGYTEDVPWRPGAFTGMAMPHRVAAEFAAGATLVVQGLHLHWEPVAVHCRGLEAALNCPAQANAYWTPPAAQGFDAHHDTHDVFVLQVSGTKRWRVYEPVLELPLVRQRWHEGLGDPGRPIMDFELGPGDTLYLPRGWPHDAETSDVGSLHLTIGLHPPTRLDALRAAVEACAGDVELRRAMGARGELPSDLLERLAARLAPEEVAARARRRFVQSRRPIQPDQISQLAALDEIAAETPVERRSTVIADLDGAVLRFEGKEVEFPAHAVEAVEAIHASWDPFRPCDLPGTLDDAGRLVLVRRLVREGYLRIVGVGAQ